MMSHCSEAIVSRISSNQAVFNVEYDPEITAPAYESYAAEAEGIND